MDKSQKLAVIRRGLGIRHKLKVHESMKSPESHEDIAVMTFAKWELEDELKAIEEILGEDRQRNVELKKNYIRHAHAAELDPDPSIQASELEDNPLARKLSSKIPPTK